MNKSVRIGPLRVYPEVRKRRFTGRWILNCPKSIARQGKRKRKFFANRELAIEAAKEFLRLVYRGEPNGSPAPSSNITLFEAIAEWVAEQEVEVKRGEKRRTSLDRDQHHFISLKKFFGDALLSELTERKLTEYAAARIEEAYSKATVKTDIVACGKLLRWAFRRNLLSAMPVLPKVRPSRPKIEVPTRTEIERLMGLLPDDLKAPVKLIVETGCRKREALNLRWEDVELDRRVIHVRSKEGWTPKTEHSERELPISESMAEVLAAQQDNGSEFVFPGRDPAKPRENLKTGFYTAVRKAGITRANRPLRVTVHILRKAYATWAANDQKLHPAVLKRLLGHSPTSTVTDGWYVGVTDAALREGVRTIDLGLNPSSKWQQSGSKPKKQNSPSLVKRAV